MLNYCHTISLKAFPYVRALQPNFPRHLPADVHVTKCVLWVTVPVCDDIRAVQKQLYVQLLCFITSLNHRGSRFFLKLISTVVALHPAAGYCLLIDRSLFRGKCVSPVGCVQSVRLVTTAGRLVSLNLTQRCQT